MKRTRCRQPIATHKRVVMLDPARLDAAHGGLDVAVSITWPLAPGSARGGLDIAVRVLASFDPGMQNQHNELLITQ
jgi:hypothetical protein